MLLSLPMNGLLTAHNRPSSYSGTSKLHRTQPASAPLVLMHCRLQSGPWIVPAADAPFALVSFTQTRSPYAAKHAFAPVVDTHHTSTPLAAGGAPLGVPVAADAAEAVPTRTRATVVGTMTSAPTLRASGFLRIRVSSPSVHDDRHSGAGR
ncbi:Protein of unknown function [Micromonospora lupini str. Lupac 08]|uniref:Uncharacterized protein n=1 Tax=Micromonospora lupini str. Lupac 08 TaxID=1150864 RepID=I0L5J1_9ACTN|nr:Protein of unknown function [Micromonospora lupini str. Lupac 08]